MRRFLDTHILIWSLSAPEKLAKHVRSTIEDGANDVLVSVASLWEIAIKQRLAKMSADLPVILTAIQQAEFRILAIAPEHLLSFVGLPMHHCDPFDRLLVAQAMAEDATLISEDRIMGLYPARLMRFSE